MTNLDKIIGDVIFVSVFNVEQFSEIGISGASGHYLLKGYDQIGLWLQHPGLVIIHSKDKLGKPLPDADHIKENIQANFVVTWNNIKTLMHYPERDGFDFPSEFDLDIGFKFNIDKKDK